MGLTDKKPFKVIESKQKARASKSSHSKDNGVKTTVSHDEKLKKKNTLKSIVGLILIALSISTYTQGLPLVVIFLGAMLGIPTTGTAADADMLVWAVTGVGFVLLVTYGLIKLCSVIWHKLVRQH